MYYKFYNPISRLSAQLVNFQGGGGVKPLLFFQYAGATKPKPLRIGILITR